MENQRLKHLSVQRIEVFLPGSCVRCRDLHLLQETNIDQLSDDLWAQTIFFCAAGGTYKFVNANAVPVEVLPRVRCRDLHLLHVPLNAAC